MRSFQLKSIILTTQSGSKPKDYTLEKWFHLVEDTLTNKLGMTMLSPRRNEEALKRAGFVNVTVRTLKRSVFLIR